MAHNSSPYIDGNRGQVYRTVNGAGTNIDPHTNIIAPHDDFTSGIGSKSLNTEYQRFLTNTYTFTITTGINYLDQPFLNCSKLKLLSLKIVSAGVSLTDFIIATNITRTADWDDIANSDYHFTTGQGENTGNQMVLIRKCSPVNPRSLASGGKCWMYLNVEPYNEIYIRVVAASAGTLQFFSYGVFL
jgi:hypothetical protein